MYETSLLIFNNLFTGNDFTQNIKWVDSKLNLKYDFLKCSWNSYCFKYTLATVPEGMNVFHFLTADNLNVQFSLRSLYSLYFPMKGWRSLLSCSAAWFTHISWECQEAKGWKEKPLDRHTAVPVSGQTWLSRIRRIPKENQQLRELRGIILLSQTAFHPGTKNINCTTEHACVQIKSETTSLYPLINVHPTVFFPHLQQYCASWPNSKSNNYILLT